MKPEQPPQEPLFIMCSGTILKHAPDCIAYPRPDTLLNELRNLLLNCTPQERLDMFEMMVEGYCVECGQTEGRCV